MPHATYRDLGFVARPDGCFDVYSAGGLGNNPRFGLKVAEKIAPEQILCYIEAMHQTFLTYGNYEQRGKARTRYMQEKLGEEGYVKAYREKLEEVLASGKDLEIQPRRPEVQKKKTAPGFPENGFCPRSRTAFTPWPTILSAAARPRENSGSFTKPSKTWRKWKSVSLPTRRCTSSI